MNTLLIAAVLAAWGCSWPIMKLAIHAMPPLWVGVFRLGIGCLVLFIALAVSGNSFRLRRQDLPMLLSVGLAQMGLFTTLIILGLTHVEAGRSAILVYTTPLWVTPIAAGFFKEPLTKITVLGLGLGILGVLWLFNPLTFNWSNHTVLLGNGLLLLAALVWSLVIIHIRFCRHQRSPLELAPWQMLLGTLFMLVFAVILEPNPGIHWSWQLAGELSYLGPIATAFAYWGIIKLNQKMPAISLSLLLLAAPVIGLLSSALILGEVITINKIIAMSIIILGLVCVILSKRKPNQKFITVEEK